MKKAIYILPLILVIILNLIGFFTIKKIQKKYNLTKNFGEIGIVKFPEFSLTDLYDQNKTLSNRDLIGELSIINVFASWCISCREEHELLLKISKENQIRLYGIAWRDIDENTINYLEKMGNPYLKIGADNRGIISNLIDINAVPETFILDKEGNLIYRQRGPINDRFLNQLEKIVRY